MNDHAQAYIKGWETTGKSMYGKTAVITGGTDGIGLAVGEELLNRGAKVMFLGLILPEKNKDGKVTKPQWTVRKEFNEKLKGFENKYGAGHVMLSETDVTKTVDLETAMQRAAHDLDGTGKIDFLLNNAGIQRQAPIDKQTPETWNAVIGINLTGKFNSTYAALPFMKEHGGHIINTSSVHGHVGSDERAPYCAAMHGTIGFTKSIAADCSQWGIKVNSISPAFIETELGLNPLRARIASGKAKDMAEATEWRIGKQGGNWLQMPDVVKEYADLLDGTKKIASGADILVGKESEIYVDNAHKDTAWTKTGVGPDGKPVTSPASVGIVIFEPALKAEYQGVTNKLGLSAEEAAKPATVALTDGAEKFGVLDRIHAANLVRGT